MKKAFKTIQIIFTILVVVLLPLIFFTLITSNTSSGVFGIRSFTVLTGSMEPAIPTGSIIFTMPASNYTVGDVITFRHENVSVTHRIVEKNGAEFMTKGDANNAADSEPVATSSVIGKNIIAVPYVGILASYLRTFQGFAIFIAVPTLIFIILEALTIKRELEKEIEKKIRKKLSLDASNQQTKITV